MLGRTFCTYQYQCRYFIIISSAAKAVPVVVVVLMLLELRHYYSFTSRLHVFILMYVYYYAMNRLRMQNHCYGIGYVDVKRIACVKARSDVREGLMAPIRSG